MNAESLNVPGVIDTKLEDDGQWFEHAPINADHVHENQIDGFQHLLLDENGNGLRRLKVRSRFTEDYEKAKDKMQMRALRMPAKKRLAFNRSMTANLDGHHCLLDWDFTDRSGQEIPFDRDLAVSLMTERMFRHHKNFAQVCIAELQGDMETAAEEDQGN